MKSCVPLHWVIATRYVDHERSPRFLPRPELANKLRVVSEHDRAKLRVKQAKGLVFISHSLKIERIGRDAPFRALPKHLALETEQRLRRRQHARHDCDRGRRPLLRRRRLLCPSLEDTLNHCRMSARFHSNRLSDLSRLVCACRMSRLKRLSK